MYFWEYSTLVFHIRFLVSNHGTRVPRLSFACPLSAGKRKEGRKELWMRGQLTRPLCNIY